MNIEEKFQKGVVDHTYQRIDSEYKVNIFLGYTDEGNMSMVITEYGNKVLVKSTKLIEVSLKKREDEKMALSFDLLDNSYKSLFLLFCNDIIYRTGDLVKPAEDGNLVFVSRKDFQVKHKGNRIELGEIEVAVNAIDGVTNAACIFDHENDKLVLYYTTADGQPMDIINLVKERIPVYMFPEVVNHLPQMPYNLNGKIDRIELKKMYEAEKD